MRTSSSIWSMDFSFMALILCANRAVRRFVRPGLANASMQQPANIIPRCTPIFAKTICPLLFVDREAFERMGQVGSVGFKVLFNTSFDQNNLVKIIRFCQDP
jgi:hypothetical protein